MPSEHWIFPPDVTPQVQEKINLLRDTKGRIASMETELTRLRLENAELEKELECYRLGVSQATLGPIARCPDEILLFIFKHFLVFDHSQIRRLLLVCKRWYNIVINSPQLWARIIISDTSRLLQHINSTLPSKIPYIVACYERSRSLPLDIELDLTDLPSVEGYLKDELYRVAEEITDSSEYDAIFEKIYDENWEYSSEWIDNELSRALGHICGANEGHVNRWKSLVLSLPDHEDIADTVWRQIRRASSSVVRLEIENLPYDWDEQELDYQDSHLPLLQHLRFAGTPDRIGPFIGAPPKMLQSLDVRMNELAFFMQFSVLRAIANFRALTLHIHDLGTEPLQFALPQLHLPQLESLTLYAVPGYGESWAASIDFIQSATSKLLQRICLIHLEFPLHIHWHCCLIRADGTEVVNRNRRTTMLTNEAGIHTLQEQVRQQVLDAMQNINERMYVKTLMVRSERGEAYSTRSGSNIMLNL